MPDWRWLASIVATVLVTFGVTLVVTDDNNDGRPDKVTVTVGRTVPQQTKVDTSPRPGRQEGTVSAPKAAVDQVAATDAGDHEGARNETPPGVSRSDLEAGREAQDRLAANDQLPAVTPDAAPSQRGCTSAFVRNYSTRRGVKPRLWVIHYTVSSNRPGIGDVNAVVNLFNTPAFAASSNYVIDREGNCKYIVRESDKAWTQAAANPFAISVEIINSGREGNLIDGPGLKKLGQIISDSAKRWNIPLRAGAVNGCAPSRSGIVTHQMLGACGGGHVDVSPYALAPIIAAAKAARAGGITATDRATCAKLNAWRRAGRPQAQETVNVARRRALEARHVRCTTAGPRPA
jgi:hypothetical protein